MSIIQSPAALSLMTSQDIYLCTTIDLMAANEVSSHPSFNYFIEEVNTPLVSPFDQSNWDRMKIYSAGLAAHNKAVAAAILAVQALYKAQANGLSTSHAMSVYRSAKAVLSRDIDDTALDFNLLLLNAFLLCLFEILIPEETASLFSESDGAFIRRLESWKLEGYHSPMALRIEAWLRMIQAAARRGGGPGFLSHVVSDLLATQTPEPPSLSLLDNYADAATSLYDLVSAPVVTFFLNLQKISAEVANLSHYHRSRITGTDQEEVAELMAQLKSKLAFLWQDRPAPMRYQPDELRAQFSRAISEPLISLVGLCSAAYHTEIVEVGRTLSDPPLASSEAKQAMRRIRDIVEGDWNASWAASGSGKLNPGYLRALFLCAIESIHPADTQWAVQALKQINNPICRSDFFASFAQGLAEAQRRKERRCTTKWFCYQTYGVPPPFL